MSWFRPFGLSDAEWEAQQVLVDGVPDHLKEPLLDWLMDQLTHDDGYTTPYLSNHLGNLIRSLTRIDLGTRAGVPSIPNYKLLVTLRALSDAELLRLVDVLLRLTPNARESDPPGSLELTLEIASSKWKPSWDGERWGLAERVPEGVVDVVEATMKQKTSASKLLQRAWVEAFGLNPDAGEAYKYAVKATETAAGPLIEPKNKGRTLGTTISALSNQPDWTLPLRQRDDEPTANRDAILALLRIIYRGQSDRHEDGVVDLQGARTAVFAAATVVAWFDSGFVSKSDS
jgi:hypothetical protein